MNDKGRLARAIEFASGIDQLYCRLLGIHYCELSVENLGRYGSWSNPPVFVHCCDQRRGDCPTITELPVEVNCSTAKLHTVAVKPAPALTPCLQVNLGCDQITARIIDSLASVAGFLSPSDVVDEVGDAPL